MKTKDIINKLSKYTVNAVILFFAGYFYFYEFRKSVKNAKVYNYFELRNDFKNYKIVDKTCVNDTCYYLELKSPIDTKKSKEVRVKAHVYFNFFVNDQVH